ncbi:MAG: peptide/nickel transport system permease protein [Thermomicrobiales bacterium]|jgi:peptide/nickel transport system permease protein|nr:peptide/nickel transport system permease protein [Thermomicrobiales bacterium]MEA2525522.1 peptide/nickel transport system permease protein [Thermomicrobiales bacterium]MEA2596868.1 peptide/nickel transport system permease protein [Thermomicrobiales bacterium]
MSSLGGVVAGQTTGQLVERTVPGSPGRRTLRRFLHHRLAVVGAFLLALLTLGAVFAPVIATHDPNAINLTKISQPPDSENWLGTDRVGRDIFTRVLYGGRISLSVGVVAVALYLAIGFVVGALAGYIGGWVDNLLMRFTEIVMCFPTFVLILILVGMLGPNIANVMFVIGLFGWTGVARLVRGQVLQLRELDFVTAARAIGGGRWYVMARHIAPNVIGPLTVAGSLGIAGAILTEAGLSFLGLGVTQPTPSWGSILNEARNPATLATEPWLWLAPGAAISLAVLAANFIGDGLRDAFDVKSRTAG